MKRIATFCRQIKTFKTIEDEKKGTNEAIFEWKRPIKQNK
jgi:hypothetical protein